MNRCPISYELCGDQKYSQKGLRLLSKSLQALKDFPFTPKEQIQLAAQLATKLSIQGIQPKLSVILDIKGEGFKIVDQGGRFILKPPHQSYDELPQNEDLTMKLAAAANIEIPLHGMIYNKDQSLTYFIKRFDRLGNNNKVAVEDFSQLLGYSRETKYESSMEQVIQVIEKHCTFPKIEKIKLFRLTIFNFLVGNEDMHLKNFSLIRLTDRVALSPSYDLINTAIILNTTEEMALPIRGRRKNLNRGDLFDYFAKERLALSESVIDSEILNFEKSLGKWTELLNNSFLSSPSKEKYEKLIRSRWKRLTD